MSYTPIRISTLKPMIEIPFSLFIYFKEQYVQYSGSGKTLEKDKFKKLKKQKIAKFYITASDESTYQKFLDNLLSATINDESISLDDKVEMVEGAGATALENMCNNPENEQSYKMTQSAARSLREIIMKNPDALKKLFGGNNDTEPIIQHSLNVCALSLKFAEALKCTDEEIDNLATAALMHDIGIVKLSEEDQKLFDKPKSAMTGKERLIFSEHCTNVTKLLIEKNYINEEIVELVRNHEENRSGTGPNKKVKITQLEEILSLVDTYDKKIICEKMTASEALKSFSIDELGNYDLKMIQKFKKVLEDEGLLK